MEVTTTGAIHTMNKVAGVPVIISIGRQWMAAAVVADLSTHVAGEGAGLA